MITDQLNNKDDNAVNRTTAGSQAFRLTNTDALVKQIQANLAEDAKAEFAAVIQELNDSRETNDDK